MTPRFRLAHALALAALAAVFAGCGAPTETDSSSPASEALVPPEDQDFGEPDQGDWLVEKASMEPAHINPLLATGDAESSYIGSFLFETLLDVDLETLELIPNLAKSWEVSDDHLEYTFHLHEDITFSDGEPLTTADVKFTYDAIQNPENDTAPLRNYLRDIESVELVDDYTIKFHMSQPYFRHLIVLGLFEILPEHIYSEGAFNKHPNNRKPIGSGPYVFDSWDTGEQIRLVRNENYWNETPHIDERVYKFITDDNAAFQVLERHELDMMEIPSQIWTTRAARPEFEREFHKITPDSPVPGYLSRYNYIGWNMRKPQFEDKRVRRALALLFDTDLIIEEIWAGLGTPISGTAYPKSPQYNHDVKPVPFDPEKAEELLTEAGWVDEDRDGVREKDGVKFQFELTYGSGVSEYDQLGTVYQEELKRAGIEITLNPLEWATFQERVHQRKFDACMLAWVTPLKQDPYQLFHSSQAENGSNYPGLKNDEIDRLLEEARVTFDEEKRNELYHQYHELIAELQPYNFLYSRPGLIAVDKRFQNVVIHKGGIDPLEWWVPTEYQRYE